MTDDIVRDHYAGRHDIAAVPGCYRCDALMAGRDPDDYSPEHWRKADGTCGYCGSEWDAAEGRCPSDPA